MHRNRELIWFLKSARHPFITESVKLVRLTEELQFAALMIVDICALKSALQPFITELVRLVISAAVADDVVSNRSTSATTFMRVFIRTKVFISPSLSYYDFQ